MTANNVKRILCLYNESEPSCDQEALGLVDRLMAAGFDVIHDAAQLDSHTDLLLLLGGDGFLMETLHELDYPEQPMFGINFGSVGFLMNTKECLPDVVKLFQSGTFEVEEHPVLEARVSSGEAEDISTVHAFNDFFLERMTRQSIRVSIALDGETFNHYAGDGFVFSTAAGSTAYNLAAGGPVLQSSLQAMVMTPLYPHRAVPFTSMQFPLVVPLSSTIEVAVSEPQKRPMRLVADGRAIEQVVRVAIGVSDKTVRILRLPGHSFVRTLTRKIIGE